MSRTIEEKVHSYQEEAFNSKPDQETAKQILEEALNEQRSKAARSEYQYLWRLQNCPEFAKKQEKIGIFLGMCKEERKRQENIKKLLSRREEIYLMADNDERKQRLFSNKVGLQMQEEKLVLLRNDMKKIIKDYKIRKVDLCRFIERHQLKEATHGLNMNLF